MIFLTAGNVHDCKVAKLCLDAMPPSQDVLGDKGYDSKDLRDWLINRGTQAVIPSRSNRKSPYAYDKTIYKQRNIIERMFCRLKDWRRIATRYDRCPILFLSACAFAATVICWL